MNTPRKRPSYDAISSRARDIWESAGQMDGQDLTHWLQAEKELLDEAAAEARETRAVPDAAPVQVGRDPARATSHPYSNPTPRPSSDRSHRPADALLRRSS